ncbi:hypothetical protein ES708_14027 [subsurface metagenome]
MRNRRKAALALLLTTIFLPVVMNKHQGCTVPDLDTYGDNAPAIRAVATAFAERQDWAIEAVETWEAGGSPSQTPDRP